MGKPRTLANTVSAGGPLADGAIGIAEVSGLQAALDAKQNDVMVNGLVKGDGAGNLTAAVAGTDFPALLSGTAITTSSGTSHEFTGIPASAKKIKLMLRNVSTTGSSNTWFRIQLGTAGGYVSSGYGATVTAISSTAASAAFDNIGFMAAFGVLDAELYSGIIEFAEIASNVWVMSGNLKASTTRMCFSAGDISLGAELTSIRFALGSSGTFDGGTINILYE